MKTELLRTPNLLGVFAEHGRLMFSAQLRRRPRIRVALIRGCVSGRVIGCSVWGLWAYVAVGW